MGTPPLQLPIPHRPYDLPGDELLAPTSPSTTPGCEWPDSDSGDGPPKRTKSALALNASTLFGIYSKGYTEIDTPTYQLSRNPSALNLADHQSTPGSLCRAREDEAARKRAALNSGEHLPHMLVRIVSLFVFGVAYGVIVTHLHDRAPIGPANTSGVTIDFNRWSKRYLVFWGIAGVGLGSLLPWLDGKDSEGEETVRKADREEAKRDWTPAVRSIGAFVGIAFAIRRLPWQSTLQVSLALALVNPFLWFIVDRTRSGFWFASLVGIAGTAFLLQISPEMIQTPGSYPPSNAAYPAEGQLIAGTFSLETVSIGTWIASVLFCSCVCFGNIGRKLAVKDRS